MLTIDKSKLIEILQHTVDAENMMHYCLSHLAHLIKNGRIRKKMNEFSELAKTNKEFLIEQLNNLGITSYLPENRCRFCNVKAESFSLLGSINLALEIIDIEKKLYKDLLKLYNNTEAKGKINQILDTKMSQKTFLKNEKKFASQAEYKLSFIDSYCLAGIVSKLWK